MSLLHCIVALQVPGVVDIRAADVLLADQWSTAASNEIEWRVRQVPFFGKEMGALVRSDEQGTGRELLLKDLIRVRFSRPGWFFGAQVEAGEYRIGLEGAGIDYLLLLRNTDDEVIGKNKMWVRTDNPDKATAAIEYDERGALLKVHVGSDALVWRFWPKNKHGALVSGLSEVRFEQVTIRTDTLAPVAALALARECAKSVESHAQFLGVRPPAGEFILNLLRDKERYVGLSDFLTDGKLNDRLGFFASSTGEAYVSYYLEPTADAKHRFPLLVRACALHEMFHMVAHRTRFDFGTVVPVWLNEGLAEIAAERALGEEGKIYYALALGKWTNGLRNGSLPNWGELLAGEMDRSVSSYYASTYRFVRALLQEPEPMVPLLDALCAMGYYKEAHILAEETLHKQWPDCQATYSGFQSNADVMPTAVWGAIEPKGDAFRVLSPKGRASLIVYPERVRGREVEVSTRFRWSQRGEPEAIIYLGYSRRNGVDSFIRLAILPRSVALHTYNDGVWNTLGSESLHPGLPVGQIVPVRVRYDEASGVMFVSVGDGYQLELDCRAPPHLDGSRVGFGGYRADIEFWPLAMR